MSFLRRYLLLLAPLPIVGASFAVSDWYKTNADEPIVRNEAHAQLAYVDRETPAANVRTANPAPRKSPDRKDLILAEAVAHTGKLVADRLGRDCQAIVRPPFVIAGDMSERELERWHSQTIAPAAQAMANSFFSVAPSEPIIVLLFSSEKSYNAYAKSLYGDEGISVYGYYKPAKRALVMNIATGGGTLVHELTHALMDFDFPKVPDWFNEGLASLYEQCRFVEDQQTRRQHIEGLINWRLPRLQQAILEKKLRPLEEMMTEGDFRTNNMGLNYAQARYFCLYLQEQGLLEKYFAAFRKNQTTDPWGNQSAAAVLGDKAWKTIDADYQSWVMKLKPLE